MQVNSGALSVIQVGINFSLTAPFYLETWWRCENLEIYERNLLSREVFLFINPSILCINEIEKTRSPFAGVDFTSLRDTS